MRSGLQKPGAIPFIALFIFSLLSLVPSLAKEWDFYGVRNGYIGSLRYDGRQSSRVKNSSTDVRSRIRATGGHCNPFDDSYPSCLDRKSHPPQSAMNIIPPRSSFEAAPASEHDAIVYTTATGSSSFTRGVSAFKAFVIKTWDDNQFFQSLSAGEDFSFPDTISLQPTPTLANLSVEPSLHSEELSPPIQSHDNATWLSKYTSPDTLLPRLHSHLCESWQQVCHIGGDFWGVLASQLTPPHRSNNTSFPSPNHFESSLGEDTKSHLEHPTAEKIPRSERAPAQRPLSNNSSAVESGLPLEPRQPLPAPTQSHNNPPATTAAQSKVGGLGPNSEHMRGSSMAIVIGLVAGIMWF